MDVVFNAPPRQKGGLDHLTIVSSSPSAQLITIATNDRLSKTDYKLSVSDNDIKYIMKKRWSESLDYRL